MVNGNGQESDLEFGQHPARSARVRIRKFPKGSTGYIIRRAGFNFLSNGGTDLAATLTYFTVLSTFPGLLAFVSLLGIFGHGEESTRFILGFMQHHAPQQMYALIEGPIQQLTTGHGAGLVLMIGIFSALWSASGYIGSFGRAINHIYGVREGRPWWFLKPINLAITTGVVLLAVLMMLMLLAGASVLNIIDDYVPEQVDMELIKVLWLNGRWLLIFVVAVVMIAMLYTTTPNIRHEKVRRMTPGAFMALTGMGIGAVGFTLYTNNFSKYNATYGLIGGVIVMLLFIWIMNNMLLFGAHLDAEIERMRQLVAGEHSEEKIRVALRDDRALEKLDHKNEVLISQASVLQHQSGGQQIMPKPKGPTLAQQVQEKAEQVRTMLEDTRETSAKTGVEATTTASQPTEPQAEETKNSEERQPKLF